MIIDLDTKEREEYLKSFEFFKLYVKELPIKDLVVYLEVALKQFRDAALRSDSSDEMIERAINYYRVITEEFKKKKEVMYENNTNTSTTLNE